MTEDFFDDFFAFMNAESKPIPKNLYSVYESGHFNHCISCEKELLMDGTLYQIQKVFKKERVIFEYALCFDCQQNLAKEYSKESTAALQNFFLENFQVSEETTHCHLCQSDEHILREHSIMGLCTNKKLIFLSVICGQCTESMQKLLSEQTKKTMRDFIDKNFPGVPEELSPAPIIKV